MKSGEDLIGKSYRSILIAWVTAMVWCIALAKPWIGLSITLGTLMATAILVSFDLVVRRVFVPGNAKPNRALIKLALIKFPVIAILLFLVVHWVRINLLAFCGGLVLVHFAMLCKVIGIRLVEHAEERRSRLGTASTKEI